MAAGRELPCVYGNRPSSRLSMRGRATSAHRAGDARWLPTRVSSWDGCRSLAHSVGLTETAEIRRSRSKRKETPRPHEPTSKQGNRRRRTRREASIGSPASVGMIARQHRAVAVLPAPSPGRARRCRPTDSHTTPSPSPSRMKGYAGWSRVTGAIPCARASAQLTRTFRLSSHAAIASGTRIDGTAAAGASPRANVINSVAAQPHDG